MKITLQQRIFGFIGIIVLTILVVVGLIVWPSINKIYGLKRDISTIENDMEQRYLNSLKLKRTMRELEEIKTQSTKYKQATIKKGDELQVITSLENLANAHDIEQNLNASLSKDEKFYQFSLLNNGTFSNHVKYLRALEALPYYMIIKDVKFEKRQSSTGGSPTITLMFNGIVYVNPTAQK